MKHGPKATLRLLALANGQRTFVSGKPCKPRGHIGPRYAKSHQCIECLKEKHGTEHYKRKAIAWRCRLLGITIKAYDIMFARQRGVCAACREEFLPTQKRCLDHDHITGKVRGIIHDSCNKVLGAVQDAPNRLREIANYLERFQ